jgi:general secretion pathway protein J
MTRPTSGLTLIEAMVSIAILAIVSTLVWGGFTQTARNKEIVERELDQNHIIRMALERMTRELSMAYVSVQTNENPSLRAVSTAFIGTDRMNGDRVDFTSFSHQRLYRDAHESDQNELSYFVTRHPDDSRVRVLARREQNRVDDDPQKGGRVQILIEGVSDFQLEYYDPMSSEWIKTWNTTQVSDQPARLPLQVKITLSVEDPEHPGREDTFATRASLPLTWGLNHALYNP